MPLPVVGHQAEGHTQGEQDHDPDDVAQPGQGHEEIDQTNPHADGAVEAGSEKPGHLVEEHIPENAAAHAIAEGEKNDAVDVVVKLQGNHGADNGKAHHIDGIGCDEEEGAFQFLSAGVEL